MTYAPNEPRIRDMAFNEAHRQRAKFVRFETIAGKRLAIRLCKETGVEFADKNGQMDFCNAKARGQWFQRRVKRGLAVLDTSLRWRGDRSDKEALADLCNIIGHFLTEDKAAGRPSW